jgi:hypothetical protein
MAGTSPLHAGRMLIVSSGTGPPAAENKVHGTHDAQDRPEVVLLERLLEVRVPREGHKDIAERQKKDG